MTKIEVDKELLQAIFDLAVNSLDFGSGFWDDEDVKWGRRAAEVLGVDPMVATPMTYRQTFFHRFSPSKFAGQCSLCYLPEESDVHRVDVR